MAMIASDAEVGLWGNAATLNPHLALSSLTQRGDQRKAIDKRRPTSQRRSNDVGRCPVETKAVVGRRTGQQATNSPRPETLASNWTEISPISPSYGSFSMESGGWSLILTYYEFQSFNARLFAWLLCCQIYASDYVLLWIGYKLRMRRLELSYWIGWIWFEVTFGTMMWGGSSIVYLYCITTVYACMQGCICRFNVLVDWNNMSKS